jgi:hypothetical protein
LLIRMRKATWKKLTKLLSRLVLSWLLEAPNS